MPDRRIVITGMGAVTPLGASVNAFWDGLIAGRCGINRVTQFDTSAYDVHIGGECLDFNAEQFLDRRQLKRMDRHAQFAMVAAEEAVSDAGLDVASIDPTRAGIILGTGIGGLLEIEQQVDRLRNKGPSKVSAFTIPKLMANAPVGHMSIRFGFQGVGTTVSTACASSANAMCDAYATILRGDTDTMLTGGTESALTPLGLAAFAAMKALSVRNDDPAKASRPFDKGRDGFVMAEGAGILVFEEMQSARARGARIYCEVVGAGMSSDASDIVQPNSSGRGAMQAMRAALHCGRMNPDDIDYINAHATSTPLGDTIECHAVKAVFGTHAGKLAMSSTKGATGHPLGAAGAMEMIACVQTLRNNTLPPTINLDQPDNGCDLDLVPNQARDRRVRTAMNNSFGFGGHNGCLIIRAI